jgi:hypothetical protein
MNLIIVQAIDRVFEYVKEVHPYQLQFYTDHGNPARKNRTNSLRALFLNGAKVGANSY